MPPACQAGAHAEGKEFQLVWTARKRDADPDVLLAVDLA
jgi:hypothetical protein